MIIGHDSINKWKARNDDGIVYPQNRAIECRRRTKIHTRKNPEREEDNGTPGGPNLREGDRHRNWYPGHHPLEQGEHRGARILLEQ